MLSPIFVKIIFTMKITWIKCFLVFLNSFWVSQCFVFFELIFPLRLVSLVSKCAFITYFACAHLPAKFYAVDLLNSDVVLYLLWSWSLTFFSISLIFVSWSVFLTKLLTSGILFSLAINAEVVAKAVILGILFSISVILAL